MNEPANVCPHGGLHRKCDLCDALVEVARIREIVEWYRDEAASALEALTMRHLGGGGFYSGRLATCTDILDCIDDPSARIDEGRMIDTPRRTTTDRK